MDIPKGYIRIPYISEEDKEIWSKCLKEHTPFPNITSSDFITHLSFLLVPIN